MIRIGNLAVVPDRREVFVDGARAELGSRAMEALLILVEANGELVSKTELTDRIWPTTVVTENNLHVQISAIRKLMGEHRNLLMSVAGRGYRLLRPAESTGNTSTIEVSATEGRAHLTQPPNSLPLRSPQLFGRDASIVAIAEMLRAESIVTLVGAGGIGKTSLAIEVARRSIHDFEGGVWVVELARENDPETVPAAVASAMGFTAPVDGRAAHAVINLMDASPTLLVLDNCEHLVGAVAEFASKLTQANPACKVLATSREALRVPGETLYHVEPLEVPDDEDSSTSPLQHSSVQLFIARVCAIDPRFSADIASLVLIGLICKRLDGIPLAIELAAARAAVLGIGVLAENIDARIPILSGGRRTALPRHQTLKATFDWSYNLLAEVERTVLDRLGVLRGDFTLDEAIAVAASESLTANDVTEAVCALTSKSLVVARVEQWQVEYRLLDATRSYALQSLERKGERDATELRRAGYLCNVLRTIRDDWSQRAVDESLEEIRRRLVNVRAALDWAFSSSGNTQLGRELAALFVPRLFDLSLVQECSDRALEALQSNGEDFTSLGEDSVSLRLLCAHASGVVYTRGPGPRTLRTWVRVVALAISVKELWFEARGVWGIWNAYQYGGRPRDALHYAKRFAEIAERDANEPHQILAQRITAIAEHYCGNHLRAAELLDQMLVRYVHPVHRRDAIGLGVHHGIVARATVARLLLVQGRTSEARQLSTTTVDEAYEYGQAMVTCYVLVESALPVSFLTGDMATARAALVPLLELSTRFGFEIWKACGECFSILTELADGCGDQLFGRFRDAIAAMSALDYLAPLSLLHGLMAAVLERAGRYTEALATLTPVLIHCEKNEDNWYYPELLRMKGDIFRRSEGELFSPMEAESSLVQALNLAQQQGAKLFEIRAAVSLADFWRSQGRSEDALRLLGPIHSAFPANQESEDASTAADLLSVLREDDEANFAT